MSEKTKATPPERIYLTAGARLTDCWWPNRHSESDWEYRLVRKRVKKRAGKVPPAPESGGTR